MALTIENLIRDGFSKSFEALIPDPINADPSQSSELRIAAVIGFTGTGIRGTLGIAASLEGLSRLGGALGTSNCESLAGDMLGEVANQMLGRVKRNWAEHGVLITLSTPLVIRGISIEISSGDLDRVELGSENDNDRVVAWLDTQVYGDIAITETASGEDLMSEGEAMLF